MDISDLQIGSSLASDYVQMVNMHDVSKQVIDNLGLPYTVPALQRMLSVENPVNTRILGIRVTEDSAEGAAVIANEFAFVVRDFIAEKMATEQPILVQAALANPKPISPNTAKNIGIGAAIALLLAMAAVAVRTLLHDKLRSEEDVAHFTGLSTIAVVPLCDELPVAPALETPVPPGALAVTRFPPLPYAGAEAFNTLSASLPFAGKDAKTFLFTSCLAGEGKTFVAMNLMRTLAGIGKRVVLVDADLRKSVLAKRYGIQTDGEVAGLSHYLAGLFSLDEIVRPTDIPNAYLVLAGYEVSNSLALLSSAELGALLKTLAERFDIVLIDAPPIGLVIDAVELAKHSDRVIFTLADDAVSRREAVEATERIRNTGCPIFGAVLNKVRFDSGIAKRYYHRTSYAYYKREDDDAPPSPKRKKPHR
jgi:capsular exopolysaccharide synthesis family protein